jgi:hypothetical protein
MFRVQDALKETAWFVMLVQISMTQAENRSELFEDSHVGPVVICRIHKVVPNPAFDTEHRNSSE